MTVTPRCSYQAAMTFSRLKVLAVLHEDGDVDRHGQGEAFGVSHGDADILTADRALWIAAWQALERMAKDDRLTVDILIAHLRSARSNAWKWNGEDWEQEWTSWWRFMPAGATMVHPSSCLIARYDAGKERLYGEINGVVGYGTECKCE